MSEQYLLEMKGICKSFPGVKALQNVDLQLKAGEVHALLGENGAGKSTLIKVLGGIYHAEEGEIIIDGQKVNIDGVVAARHAGISIVHQELVLVPYMTVAENIFLGREPGTKMNVDRRKMVEEAQKLLDTYEMNIDANMLVERLTIAQQQMVEIVKAISFNSKILVLDEPTSSISDKEVGFLFNTMRNLTKAGVGIIYISHKMSELAEICDRVTVMRDGQTVGTKVVKETTTDDLIALMVGRELTNYYTRDYLEPGEVILKCEHISDGKMAKDASFELHKGEIIGFAGLVGAGRSETMKAIFGLAPHATGDVYVKGEKVKIKSPIDALKYGIALVPENRKEEGLYKVQSVRFNSTIEVLGSFIRHLHVDGKKEEEITQKYIDMMKTKTPSQDQIIGNLSGGNQQKVIIGRWLATEPDILILDEPTRGVDVGAKAEIYAIMNELVKQGMSIIMISSELPEIINMSDRIYVMNEGRVTGCLDHDTVTQESIMTLAAK
ncbi:sugar ABC transporter ATP-binding protein [Hominiventricola filiformis]|uniref:Ribose/galactose/methyl galactoside import ATP-binding protein n=1 Tax=Hominiventricola filiformis TaxID=2885352 RepID=A0AAE3DAA3_9FIRM|nr:sugar ABC transporter ATP-binding protein [Hominiventricola filiformis]MCC2125572.1 sugar ABC transporter ATP-binding protein [Hominiventricola filiformis]